MTKTLTSANFLPVACSFLRPAHTATFIPGLLIGYFGEKTAPMLSINGVIFAVLFMVLRLYLVKVTWERRCWRCWPSLNTRRPER